MSHRTRYRRSPALRAPATARTWLALASGLAFSTVLPSGAAAQEQGHVLFLASYEDFSDGRGERAEGKLVANFDLGRVGLVVEGASARRDYGAGTDYSGKEGRASLYVDWNEWLTTRTILAISSDDPVFANREMGQEVSVRPGGGLVLSGGYRALDYFGDVDVSNAWGGPTYYFHGGFARYTYGRYDIEGSEATDAHLLTVRINDAPGARAYTQGWAGTGSSLVEQGFVPDLPGGRQTGVALQRMQPLGERLGLILGVRYARYETDFAEFEKLGGTLGLRVDF